MGNMISPGVKESIKDDILNSSKRHISKHQYMRQYQCNEKTVREAIAELNESGHIFMPLGRGVYARFNGSEEDIKQIEHEARKYIKASWTTYFRQIKPRKNLIKDLALRQKIEQLELLLEEKGN